MSMLQSVNFRCVPAAEEAVYEAEEAAAEPAYEEEAEPAAGGSAVHAIEQATDSSHAAGTEQTH